MSSAAGNLLSRRNNAVAARPYADAKTALRTGSLATEVLGGPATAIEVLGGGSSAVYLRGQAEEILWLGMPWTPPHRRAIIVTQLPDLRAGETLIADRGRLVRGGQTLLDITTAPLWQARAIDDRAPAAEISGRLATLARYCLAEPVPVLRAVCRLLLGRPREPLDPGDPFTARAVAALSALLYRTSSDGRALDALPLQICRDTTLASLSALLPLIGLGPGLTPSGDDVVGGLLFARTQCKGGRSLIGSSSAAGCLRALDALAGETSPISIALLRDFARGHGPAPLHELAFELLSPASSGPRIETVQHVLAIGHSSGSDLLAGCLTGMAMRAGPAGDAWG